MPPTYWIVVVIGAVAATHFPPHASVCNRSRTVLTEPWGLISDGPPTSNYSQDSHCEWLITSSNNSSQKFITLVFRSMATECSYDYLFVYDGDTFEAPLLATLSGTTRPQQMLATSGSMLLLFYSDTNYVLKGFRAEYSITDCPHNCTNHGQCVASHCRCESGWSGSDCSHRLCTAPDCPNGVCDPITGRCRCSPGRFGTTCSLSATGPNLANNWHWLSHTHNLVGSLRARTAHTAVYVNVTDAIYVFGGYDLNVILADFAVFHIGNSTWTDIDGVTTLTDNGAPTSVRSTANMQQRNNGDVPNVVREQNGSFLTNLLYAAFSRGGTTTSRDETTTHVPRGRFGHAAAAVQNNRGFLMYGGRLGDGTISNELWYFDAIARRWQLRAVASNVQPPPLVRHTLTYCGDDMYYVFGGSTASGEFSARLFRIVFHANRTDEQWTEVYPRGGKTLDVRLVAHTATYHAASDTLIVFGGIAAAVARYSKLSDRMFAYHLRAAYWTELHYGREMASPRERAFHTAHIFHDYLVVFGGYTHRHNHVEQCYDATMYAYHLGCHTWVTLHQRRYPKQQGVFGHAMVVRPPNLLVLIGGYHGNVHGDTVAYVVPPMLVDVEPETQCRQHRDYDDCLADPECGWCTADDVCYGRYTGGVNCTTNLQTVRCAGVCAVLGECRACLLFGDSSLVRSASVAHKLRLDQCSWCAHSGRCHRRDDAYGRCGGSDDSKRDLLAVDQCRLEDKRPGLTFIKYYHPVNFTHPDVITIVNSTSVVFSVPLSSLTRTDNAFMVGRLLGELHLAPHHLNEILSVCLDYCSATVLLDGALVANVSADQLRECSILADGSENMRNNNTSLFTSVLPIKVELKKLLLISSYNAPQSSRLELVHYSSSMNRGDVPKVFTAEYLTPFSTNGTTCSTYANCLHCVTDLNCGWCDALQRCVERSTNEVAVCHLGDAPLSSRWQYLVLEPAMCTNCSNYVTCDACVNTTLCEWWVEEARCVRIGRRTDVIQSRTTTISTPPPPPPPVNAATQQRPAIITVAQCPIPCHVRRDCDACVQPGTGRCVWCKSTRECFNFATYTSEYQFGRCREWVDQSVTAATPTSVERHGQCDACSMWLNCSQCMRSLGCGWCYSAVNPTQGVCTVGGFKGGTDCNETAGSQWTYAKCPDVDECRLGLHDCHAQAICTNTDGSYTCQCRRGYEGDGRATCARTCSFNCVHGRCQGAPTYKCRCDLGWYGEDCSRNCRCNHHASCSRGEGICDQCQNRTIGPHCERCAPGSFGNATTAQGCRSCQCNGHERHDLDICDVQTGKCHCQHHTVGMRCERCADKYYGDPRNGKHCYRQCEGRAVLTDADPMQGISSMQTHNGLSVHHYPWVRPMALTSTTSNTKECLWIIQPGGFTASPPIIQLRVNSSQLNVTCGENAVYVYDGLPAFIDVASQNSLTTMLCNGGATQMLRTESKTGQLIVHYKMGVQGEGFNALYSVMSCESCVWPRVCLRDQCVCPDGYVGYDCEQMICPQNCSYATEQGICDRAYGRCLCRNGWSGAACDIRPNGRQIVFSELFNTNHLADHVDHLRKTLPRFGHSLTSDRRGARLWMFGGYSLSHGPLNDIRLFDAKNQTWMQVTVDGGGGGSVGNAATSSARMPPGRYFHGADIVGGPQQTIYIFGGLTHSTATNSIASDTYALDDFWQFDVQMPRWTEVERGPEGTAWPPPLLSHTVTVYQRGTASTPTALGGGAIHEVSLVVIGGVSPQRWFLATVWEFRVGLGTWHEWQTRGHGPLGIYGHTTVFHRPTDSFYVFGGYVYEQMTATLSNRLYVLKYGARAWTKLNTLGGVAVSLPRARFLHSAITTADHMIVVGGLNGRLYPWTEADTLYAYSYSCNQWVNLMSKAIEKIGLSTDLLDAVYAPAMTSSSSSSGEAGSSNSTKPTTTTAYLIGGRTSTDAEFRVVRIDLPRDLCTLWMSRSSCLGVPGCAYCAHKQGDQIVRSACYSNTGECPLPDKLSNSNLNQTSNQGKMCDEPPISVNTSRNLDCVTCIQIRYHWCQLDAVCMPPTNTSIVGGGQSCWITRLKQCPLSDCLANDCFHCHKLVGCVWNFMKRRCVTVEGNFALTVTAQQCLSHCAELRMCSRCVATDGCHWSTQLGECISAAYQPIYCAGGVCGLVLRRDSQFYCPEPCSVFTQCSACLRRTHCGWCAMPGHIGVGHCVEGSNERPNNVDGMCGDLNHTNHTWHYVKCPPENECLNGHHTCTAVAERCQDLDDGYKCVCGEGYQEDNSPSGACRPICSLGCVRGHCTSPQLCQCDFGYVGANCSIQCQCHGHSNCAGPDRLDECPQCHNNTMGKQCEQCKPLFVGDPKQGTACVPCQVYCNGHSAVCIDRSLLKGADASQSAVDLVKQLIGRTQSGAKYDAICLSCANNTTGERCDECVPGYFRGTEDLRVGCRPCQCHGHGDICDAVTGDQCNCRNNTETDICDVYLASGVGGGVPKLSLGSAGPVPAVAHYKPCWSVQCSKCKDGYLGTPIDGFQCYRQMSVDAKMCFDGRPFEECQTQPPDGSAAAAGTASTTTSSGRHLRYLSGGEMGFFVIQPRFMNVDIRIVIDVTVGRLNVYLSTHEDTYRAVANTTGSTWWNTLEMNEQYRNWENNTVRRPLDTIVETEATGLRTFIRVEKPRTVLKVHNVKNRLVITLPEEYHSLETTRFFLVLQSIQPDADGTTYGVLFSRQDQLHIDLFVFFSVFFSCFFLFLAACVVAWKTKQAADMRRARRQHVVEMLHMAQRPFGIVLITLEAAATGVADSLKSLLKRPTQMDHVKPVAVEPTEDGVAAVATVLVKLPGGQKVRTQLALASTLILLSKQHPHGGRTFLRRRSTNYGVSAI